MHICMYACMNVCDENMLFILMWKCELGISINIMENKARFLGV